MNDLCPAVVANAVSIGELLYAACLPPPLSVNNLYINTAKFANKGRAPKGRRKAMSYEKWLKEAGQMLISQGPRPALYGPMALLFTMGDDSRSCKFDTDNAGKAYIDLLVTHGVLPDDNKDVVRHLALTWQPGDRCTVHVFRWEG